jgi:hypothetical protein
MKIISWVAFIVISVLGYNATTEAPTEVSPPTFTIASDPPRLRSKTSSTTTTTTIAPSTTTTTEPVPGIDAARYPELWATAVETGWSPDRLPTLDLIIFHESRGDLTAVGTGAYGVTQIQWSAHKQWLTTELDITEPEQLFDPYTNLEAALWLAEYAETHYGCWAQPWYMSLKNPYRHCT